jgi:hypothetical protein
MKLKKYFEGLDKRIRYVVAVIAFSGVWLLCMLVNIHEDFFLQWLPLFATFLILFHLFDPILEDINGEKYAPDPFNYFHISGEHLVFIKHRIPLSTIKQVSLSTIGEHGFVSLPLNNKDGKVPALYFDKGFMTSMRRLINTSIPNAQLVD